MNLVLIGYRGTGKSVVGRQVAERLGRKYVSLDQTIVDSEGMPIPELVRQHGWTHFRDVESEVTRRVSYLDDQVIDTGGGVVERPENVSALQTNGLLIWLKASAQVIASRIQGDTNRPALTEGKSFLEEISEVLERRTPLYRAAAAQEIDTDPLTVSEVVDRILRVVQ